MKVQNARHCAALMKQAQEKGRFDLADKYVGYVAKNARKAVELGKRVKGEEELKGSMSRIVQAYEEMSSSLNQLHPEVQEIQSQTKDSETSTIDQQAEKDLERMLGGYFTTLGSGTEVDRAAQLVIQSLEVLYGRLDNPGQIKLIYFEMNGKDRLPPAAASILEKYTGNQISLEQARSELKETIQQYSKAFERKGIKPADITWLFGKT